MNSKGIGLIEAIIASAIVLGVSLSIITLMNKQKELQSQMEKRDEIAEALKNIKRLLAAPENCFETFKKVKVM